jgi:hypothetical protein
MRSEGNGRSISEIEARKQVFTPSERGLNRELSENTGKERKRNRNRPHEEIYTRICEIM